MSPNSLATGRGQSLGHWQQRDRAAKQCDFEMDDGQPCGEAFSPQAPNARKCPRHTWSPTKPQGKFAKALLRKRRPNDAS